jgi:uncharacterized SAM-binding protein YcdF (DUF218 family)
MFWTIPDNPPPNPDCFVILSYAVRKERPNKPTIAEIELAYQWWKKFPNAKLIMSTGDNQKLGMTNAEVMAQYTERELGVPSENIIKENRSINTRENLIYSKEIIDALQLKQPTLVTIDLFARRSVATAKKLGWKDFYWLSVYSQGEPAYGAKGIQTYSRATIFSYELVAMFYSKFVGWV